MVKEICDQVIEPDGMVFDSVTVIGQVIEENTDTPGVRLNFRSRLGSARVCMQMDIGFSDVITPQAVLSNIPTLLGMPAPRMPLYPPETVIAEKLQAMVYLGEINSRMKDFYDIWLLSRRFDFDGAILQKAIVATFQNRKTPISIETPIALTDQFAA
jgi:Nucleotidyl transferase AbiEii toxin, Type IV TA system